MGRRTERPARRHSGDDEPEQVLYLESGAAPGQTVRLEGGEAVHARKSLRLRTGDPVHMVDGRGGRFAGVITNLDKHGVDVHVDTEERVDVWPRRPVWLGAGVLRSTRMDFLIEKASELGVTRFVPLLLNRCVARPAEDGAKQERWHRLAVESLKQSRRARLLDLAAPADLDAFLDMLPEGAELWVADPEGRAPAAVARDTGDGPLVLVVGPEGGLAPEERGVLERAGGRFVRLGGHRLRAETAVVTLLASALATLGEMDPPAGTAAPSDGV